MKLARIANPMFQMALNKLISQPLPLRAAFKLKGIAAKVRDEFAKFEEARKSGLEKYGTKDEEGNLLLKDDNAQLTPENMEAFGKELSELADTDVEIPTIRVSELGDKVEFSADELSLLDEIVIDG